MEEHFLPRPKIARWVIIAFLVLAVVGFGDSAFLTAEHIRGSIPPCSVTEGCSTVLTSAYATVAGIPIAAAGMAYYVVLIILVVAYLDTGVLLWLHRAAWLTVAGVLASLYFLVIQAFVLHAFCPYCLLSAGTSLGLFVLGVIIMKKD